MDLNKVRSELAELSALVDGWEAPDAIYSLERDLVLEKLRTLYEAVRFDRETVSAEPAAENNAGAVPVAIDLGEVLSLDILSEPEAVGQAEAEPDPEAEPETEPEAVFEELTVETAPADEIVPEAAAEAVAQAGEVAGDPEPESAPGAEAVPEPVAEPVTEPKAELAAVPEPEAEPAPVPEPSRPIAPTLFELEAETIRHRHKQRVIMSLYNTGEPSAPERAAAKPAPAPAAEPVAEKPIPAPETEQIPAEPVAEELLPKEPTVEKIVYEKPAVEERATDPEPNLAPAADVEELLPVENPAAETSEVSGAVLGDVINHDVQTLADTITPPRDVASELRRSEPVGDLRKAIGINDKFLLIRDLFGGDGAAYEETIGALNGFGDLDDCMIYIAENYAWNANSDGAKLLMELLERKFA